MAGLFSSLDAVHCPPPPPPVLDPLIPVTSEQREGGRGRVDQDPILAAPKVWTPHIRYTTCL